MACKAVAGTAKGQEVHIDDAWSGVCDYSLNSICLGLVHIKCHDKKEHF